MKAKPQKFVAYTFSVIGCGAFPLDMLRYDRCAPQTQNDASKMMAYAAHEGTMMVKVMAFVPADRASAWGPTQDRWASFGWHVVDGSIEKVLTFE